MEFRRDDDRFTVSAVRSERCPPPPDLTSGHGWELRCRQRAGEASSTTSLGCVPTRDVALDTLLRYMERINETIEGEIDRSPGATIELLAEERTIDDPDAPTRTERTAERLSP